MQRVGVTTAIPIHPMPTVGIRSWVSRNRLTPPALLPEDSVRPVHLAQYHSGDQRNAGGYDPRHVPEAFTKGTDFAKVASANGAAASSDALAGLLQYEPSPDSSHLRISVCYPSVKTPGGN